MKKEFLAIVAITLLAGCTHNPISVNPSSTPTATPTATSNSTTYSMTLNCSTNSMNGCPSTCTWINANNPTTIEPNTDSMRITTGANLNSISLGLISINVANYLPVNASITSAYLQMQTGVYTALNSGTYVFGVHDMNTTANEGFVWTRATASWDQPIAGVGWNGGTSSAIQAGVNFNSTPMSAVTITASQVNGNPTIVAWNLTPSTVQYWLSHPSNNGLVIAPEPLTSASNGYLDLDDENNSTYEQATLVVNYTIP